MVSEAPSLAPVLEAGGEGTVEKGPGEGGIFPSESPGNLLFGAALPACADCGSAEQAWCLLPHGGALGVRGGGRGQPSRAPKTTALGNHAMCTLCLGPSVSYTKAGSIVLC